MISIISSLSLSIVVQPSGNTEKMITSIYDCLYNNLHTFPECKSGRSQFQYSSFVCRHKVFTGGILDISYSVNQKILSKNAFFTIFLGIKCYIK